MVHDWNRAQKWDEEKKRTHTTQCSFSLVPALRAVPVMKRKEGQLRWKVMSGASATYERSEKVFIVNSEWETEESEPAKHYLYPFTGNACRERESERVYVLKFSGVRYAAFFHGNETLGHAALT